MRLKFAKGHGTENDFVLIDDLDAELTVTPALVACLCDRRVGIGADGLLRVVRAGALADAGVVTLPEGVERSMLFMDYYNADGSTAQMCGNGVRVFAHWVLASGFVDSQEFPVATRAGVRHVVVHAFDEREADVSVAMGPAEVLGVSTCKLGGRSFAGLGVDMGNPHLACVVPGLQEEQLAALAFEQPVFDDAFFPEGVNIEVCTELADGHLHMRVFERGVGETRSCGTGTVAAACAALADAGAATGSATVHVTGGAVEVTIGEGESTLRGPSAIVATGTTVMELPGLYERAL